MTKSELINSLAGHNPELADTDVRQIVETFFECISARLVDGGRVEIRGFGSFCTRAYGAKQGTNPKNGAQLEMPETRLPRFKPARAMSYLLNQLAE